MPSFQRSLLPFCRCRRSCRCRCARTELLETSFRCAVVHKWPEGWLVVHQRQNGKNRIQSYLLRNGSYGATAGGNGNGATKFFYVGNVILTALTPGFQRSVAVLPLPLRARTKLLKTSFRIRIGMKWPERWLVVHPLQNGKNRIRSYICYGTAVTAQRQVGTATAQRNGGNQQRNSYGANGILAEFVSTATAERPRNSGN